MAPRLSLVIPCFQDADTLGRALTSVAGQTRPPDEVIVVDDASPEGAKIRAVLTRYPNCSYLRNVENLGLAGARNAGLAKATGDLVAFLDADDEAHPQRLEWQLAQLEDWPECRSAVTCDAARIAPGEDAPKNRFAPPVPVRTYLGVGWQAYANRLTGASLMAPAALLRAVGGYDASLRSCEDYDLWLRLLARGATVRRIRRPLYLYHQNPAGLSRRTLEIARWELAAVERLVRRGDVGPATSLRAGSVWAVWLLRHLLRAARLRDPALHRQTDQELARLAGRPLLRAMLRLASLLLMPRTPSGR